MPWLGRNFLGGYNAVQTEKISLCHLLRGQCLVCGNVNAVA